MAGIDKDIIHKEIDLIEGCINRMAKNSFLIKGWTISLIGIVLAMMPKGEPVALFYGCIILMLAVIAFWNLDAFYLNKEKMFIKLYETVVLLRLNGNDDKLYNLNCNRMKDKVKGIRLLSPSLIAFYLPPILLLIMCMLYNRQFL